MVDDYTPPEGIARPNDDMNFGDWNSVGKPRDFTPTAGKPASEKDNTQLNEAQKKWSEMHGVRSMSPEEKARAAKDGADIVSGKTIMDFDKERRESIDKQFTYSASGNANKSAEVDVVGNATNKSYTQGLGNGNAGAKNSDIANMVSKIENMNRINGAAKSIDAVATAQKLSELYGDKAEVLLDKAITEPTNYATAIGASVGTSREAVNHLKGIDKDKAKEFAEQLLGEPISQTRNADENTSSAQKNTDNSNDKRLADIKSMTNLAINSPEQYQMMKNMYMGILAGQLPGIEMAQYFLEIMKVVEGGMEFLNARKKDKELSGTSAVAVNNEADKKREEDKNSCRNLFKDQEKFAKAKGAYEGIAKNGSGAEKERAQYYLSIMNEVEQESALKKTLTNDAQAAVSKSNNVNKIIEDYTKKILNGGLTLGGNDKSGQSHINLTDLLKNNKQNTCF